MKADRRRRILRACLHRRARRCHDQQPIARHGEFGCIACAGLSAEQGNGARLGEIDAAPLEPGADRTRAFACPAQNLLQPARIAAAACTENGRVAGAGGIDSHKLTALHAFDIDEAQAVTGVDRHGDGPAARHGVALLAGSEREDTRPLDGRRPRRSRPDTLVAGKNQHFAPLFRSRVSQASGGRGPVQERRKQPIRRYCNL